MNQTHTIMGAKTKAMKDAKEARELQSQMIMFSEFCPHMLHLIVNDLSLLGNTGYTCF